MLQAIVIGQLAGISTDFGCILGSVFVYQWPHIFMYVGKYFVQSGFA